MGLTDEMFTLLDDHLSAVGQAYRARRLQRFLPEIADGMVTAGWDLPADAPPLSDIDPVLVTQFAADLLTFGGVDGLIARQADRRQTARLAVAHGWTKETTA